MAWNFCNPVEGSDVEVRTQNTPPSHHAREYHYRASGWRAAGCGAGRAAVATQHAPPFTMMELAYLVEVVLSPMSVVPLFRSR
jgi:hypothetical protein